MRPLGRERGKNDISHTGECKLVLPLPLLLLLCLPNGLTFLSALLIEQTFLLLPVNLLRLQLQLQSDSPEKRKR